MVEGKNGMRTAAYPATVIRRVRPASRTSAAETETPPFEEIMQGDSDLLRSNHAASPPPPSTISESRGLVRPNSPPRRPRGRPIRYARNAS